MMSREERHLYYRCAIEGGEGVLVFFFYFFFSGRESIVFWRFGHI